MDKNFYKNIERLVNPISVGSLHFIQSFNRLLPKSIQRKLVESSAKKTSSMGFVVEPYATFLCYEITDLEKAKSLLPEGFELVKTRIFADDEPKYYAIFGCTRAHTSAFWGLRNEFYIIAEDQKTKMLSWIIVDYDTDTISYDKGSGLRDPNAIGSVITTDCNGQVIIDVKNNLLNRELVFEADTTKGEMAKLDQRLWLEGNLSIGYGKVLSLDDADIFSLKFCPCEVEKALKIPTSEVNITSNTWYKNLFEDKPSQVACFPYSQHFISDSPGYSSNIKNRDELVGELEKLDFKKINVFSTDSFRRMFILSGLISLTITIILIVLLIVK